MQTSTHGRASTKLDLALLILTVVTLYLSLFRFPYYPYLVEGDSLLFLSAAGRMMGGEYLYRDVFEITFPGTHVLYLSLFLVFGIKYWVYGLAVILAGAAHFWITLQISRKLIVGGLAALPAVLFIFFGFRQLSLDGSHRIFSPIFAMAAAWVLLKSTDAKRIAAAGALCAVAAFFTQQRGVLAIAGLIVFLFLHHRYTGGGYRRFVPDAALLLATFLFAIAVLCSYFVATAGFETFLHSTFVYPARHYSADPQNNFGALFLSLSGLYAADGGSVLRPTFTSALLHSVVPLFVYVAFVAAAIKSRISKNWERWRGVTLVVLVGVFLYFGTTGPHALRLFNVSAPALIAGAWLLHNTKAVRNYGSMFAAALSVAVILLSWSQIIRTQRSRAELEINSPRGKVLAPRSPQVERYSWIVEHTRPGEYVFEAWPGYIYFLPALRNPSPYNMILPTDYTRPEWVQETVRSLRSKPTRYVLWDDSYNKPHSEREAGDHTGIMSEYLTSEYEPTGFRYKFFDRDFQIWEKKRSDEGDPGKTQSDE